MKLDKGSFFFNMTANNSVATAGWGTSLGGQVPPFPIDKPGAPELIKAMNSSSVKIKFDLNNKKHVSYLKSPKNHKIIAAAKFDKVFVNGVKLDTYFILLATEEIKADTKEHLGRNTLKYNPKIAWNNFTNEDFKNKVIIELGGGNPAWMCHDISVKNNDELHFSVIKVSDTPKVYTTNAARKKEWEKLIGGEESESVEDIIIAEFKDYLLNVHKIQNKKSANEYVSKMIEVSAWFLSNKIVDSGFNIWIDTVKIEAINENLNNKFKDKWAKINAKKTGKSGFLMAPWNRWTEFVNWRNGGNTDLSGSLNQILYGPPGTGKTYSTIIKALQIVAPEIYKKHKGSYSKLKLEFNKLLITDYSKVKQDGQIAFCTFHQSMSYEDFIEGIKPELENKTKLEYTITEGIFKKMSAWAESALESKKKYVLIIDEINRGNISQIFGELITLIEDDKRIGQAHSLTAFLPYSKKPFGVPDNLHIIGTMNTADRSVEALDTALRRRFYFKEMPPMYEGFENIKEFKDPVTKIDLKLLLKAINNRLEVLLSRDHLIGHSYFLNVAKGKSSLAHVFEHNIIPLLQEYFYGDFEKIAMVIGKSFVEGIKGKAKANQFMIESDSESDYFDKDIWTFNKDLFNPNNKNSFAKAVQLIYN
jgi:hypothetical protein